MKHSRRKQGGYSLVEVMMALAVLTAGSVGVMALQQASLRGNVESRQLSTATSVARIWLERLKRDARLWNEGANAANPAFFAQTCYLSSLNIAEATAPAGVWQSPAPISAACDAPVAGLNGTESASFDYYGNEVAPGGANVRFCAQTRLQWVTPGQTIRAEVRAFWARTGDGVADCTNVTDAIEAPGSGIHVVRASTMLRWVPR